MKARLGAVLRRYAIILCLGIAYYIFVSLTDIGIPCIFLLVTGLQCPGCGISRMLMALVRLDFVSAFHYNPVVLLTAPMILFILIRCDIDYIKTGTVSHERYRFFWIAELVLLLVFGVFRNIS